MGTLGPLHYNQVRRKKVLLWLLPFSRSIYIPPLCKWRLKAVKTGSNKIQTSWLESDRWQEYIHPLRSDSCRERTTIVSWLYKDISGHWTGWVILLPDRSLTFQSCLPASQRYPWRSRTLTHKQRQGRLGWGILAPATSQFCPLPNSTWNWDVTKMMAGHILLLDSFDHYRGTSL